MKRYTTILVLLMLALTGWAQEEQEPDINAFVFVDEEPRPLNMKEVREIIGYPPQAVEAGIQGTVIARILVDGEGKYRKHRIIMGSDSLLQAAVEAHISKLNFTPAIQEGKPVMFWLNVPFSFRLVEDETNTAEAALAALDELIAEDSTNHAAYLKRGLQKRSMNQLDEAISDFSASITYNPELSALNTPEPAEEETGRKKKKKKKKKEPEVVVSPEELAAAREARTYLSYAYFARGTSYATQGKMDEAYTDITEAIKVAESIEEPDSSILETLATAYMERGFVAFQQEKFEQALADYDKVLNQSPEMRCSVYPLIADVRLAQNNPADIVAAYNDLISCNPDDELLFYSRGYYKSQAGDYDAAIEDLRVTTERSANANLRIAAFNRIGWSYRQKGDYEAALAAIQEALNVNVLNALSYFYRAQVYLDQDKKDEACADLRRSLDYGLEGEELPQAEALLQEHCPDAGENE